MQSVRYLSIAQVEHIHELVIAETGGTRGIVNPSALAAAVERARAGIQDHEFYPSIHEKAAALLHSLITTHPFADGNKRTGVMAAEVFLRLNGYELDVSQLELEEFAVHVAVARPEVADIAGWLRLHTRRRETDP